MATQLLVYGANGYTGELTARMAVERGMRPVLAGRNARQIELLGRELDLTWRVFDLDTPSAVEQGLDDIDAVLHCAGPFIHTSKPMVDACIGTGVHYLDITGEIEVFESLAQRHKEATEAGVMLLPGAGFDVVPTDCMAAHLHRRLPTATHLILAFHARGSVSRGTAATMIGQMGRNKAGFIRRNGVLTPVPTAWKIREFDFGSGPRTAMTIPWGDVSTAFHSTSIPNIEVYMAVSPRMVHAARMSGYFGLVIGMRPVQSLFNRMIRAGMRGPNAGQRARGRSIIWGQASDDKGNCVASRMQTPEGYTLTALASLLIADKVLAGRTKTGFQTPSSAFGPDLVLEIPGVTREDMPLRS